MKKWSQALDKLSKDVKDALNVSSKGKPDAFKGTGRKLGAADPKPVPSNDNPRPSTSQPRGPSSSSRAAQAATSPYDTILKSIDDEAATSALATMLARVGDGKQQREETQESMRILRKVLINVVADPENDKFRTLRLANGKIQNYVARPAGAQDLLVACGFSVQMEDPDDAMLVIRSDVARERAGLMRRVVRVIETLLGIKAETTTMRGTGMGTASVNGDELDARDAGDATGGATRLTDCQEAPTGSVSAVTVAGRPTSLELPAAVEGDCLPPEFYEQSLAEVQSLYRHNQQRLEQSKVLMTKAQREKLRLGGKTVSSKPVVRVRIRAPDGVKIVGDFQRQESLQSLFTWLAACLDERIVEFDLVTPPPERRSVGQSRFDAEKTICDVLTGGCAGDVTLNLVLIDGEGGRRELGFPIFNV